MSTASGDILTTFFRPGDHCRFGRNCAIPKGGVGEGAVSVRRAACAGRRPGHANRVRASRGRANATNQCACGAAARDAKTRRRRAERYRACGIRTARACRCRCGRNPPGRKLLFARAPVVAAGLVHAVPAAIKRRTSCPPPYTPSRFHSKGGRGARFGISKSNFPEIEGTPGVPLKASNYSADKTRRSTTPSNTAARLQS